MNSFGTIGVLLSILRFIPPIAVLLILESFDVFWWNYCSTTFWYFPFILLFIFLFQLSLKQFFIKHEIENVVKLFTME